MTLFRYLLALVGMMVVLPFASAQLVETERVQIQIQRQQLEAGFSLQDAACHQRFAVNNCLIDVNIKRREAMADLQRQEILLNDDERKRRGAEQIRKIEEKLSTANRQETVDRRAQVLSEYEARAKRGHETKAAKNEKFNADAGLVEAGATKRVSKKQRLSGGRATPDVGKADQYHDRQAQAHERRIKHEVDASKRPPSTARSLPVPP